MPGSVQNAAPADVLPQCLCTAFSAAREFAVMENRYVAGESQASITGTVSRKFYQLTRRLTAVELATLRTFYLNHRIEPFYAYNPWETNPKFSYDATGVATTGRHTVRFDGEWSETVAIPRSEVGLRLVEVA